MNQINTDVVLDAKGLACPMPIVRTKKAMNHLDAGQVIEVHATDKGSKADLQAWAKSSGHEYLGTIEDEDVLKHFIRKASNDEAKERKHGDVISNEELVRKLADPDSVVIDVRESAEYAFRHIPGAVSIPLGELEFRYSEVDKNKNIFVVCRTGNRSDIAAQMLTDKGFPNVTNVVPGMSQWNGEVESNIK
ncbi:rhodanese-related sulfurtransferase/TusA-related sulfurtransferase [Bacillus pakistanensis]|uniref:Rhodanese-related sulfurtransferase/TusA-related sulfurtransferase n=1 Tax=Rossellomorea pakistanensis TaxID=992288 RepID=A0ABS2N6U1_9BACI|nr:sulfurtransferase TusA family protein [Bacillus pakistanensis]MBM7583580.1 rhodanese-related sulfurtransferase/TusA-related sulfurtransferase [Bacillus pakistanensis]